MKYIGLTAFAIMILASSACFTTKVYFEGRAGGTPHVEYQDKWHHNIILGLVEISDPIRLNELCPEKVSYVEQKTSFVNGFVEGLTSNLYNPQSVTVYCLGGGMAEAVLDDGGEVMAYLPLTENH